MKQHYMVIDISLCHDCNNCFMACKDEHIGNQWLPYTDEQPRHGHKWINILSTERGQFPCIDVGYLPVPCQHCQDAPCIKAYPECVSRREDGVVLINRSKAKGVKGLVDSCPYGAIYWNEEANIAQKCTMCAHLLDGNEELKLPRCSHSCPTDAIAFYTLEPAEMARKIRDEKLEVYKPELGAKPHVFYKNLYRFEKAFVAGDVLQDGECAEGVTVTLTGKGVNCTQATDYFGDFKFDGLDSGEYAVSVEAAGQKYNTTVLIEKESRSIGPIRFTSSPKKAGA
jgi:Fe-S-cluster-containing dehydrogenase component